VSLYCASQSTFLIEKSSLSELLNIYCAMYFFAPAALLNNRQILR